ncbi:hypothetical protein [Runella sp.]|uniref:hypothetical protein n=1 Tax=Runella sp. TaxID=1960881 RepID=UPI003D0D0FB2
MKIGIIAGVVASVFLIIKYYTDEPSVGGPSINVPALKALPHAQAAIVYFEFEPDPNRYEDQQLKLRIERRTDNKLYLVDDSKPEQGRTTYYALNGSVNRVDARQLTQQPLLPNRWIHLVKYVTEVSNVNSEGWLTSAFNVASGQAKFAAAYEAIFWVRDSLQKTPSQLAYTQPLWPNNGAVGDSKIFKQTPAFKLINKKYGSESLPLDEPVQNLRKVSWNVNANKFKLLYAGEVDALIKHIRPKDKQGITRFDSRQLDQAADWLAKNSPSDIFSVDFEPGKPEEGWYWDMSDPNFRKTMYELSDRIYKKHGKLFYSWIGEPLTFDFKGKSFKLDGYANDNWSSDKKNIDDYLAIHQGAKSIQNVQSPSPIVLMTGFGYTSTTVNTSDANDQPPQVWKAPVNWYLRTLDMLNLKSLTAPPNVKLLNFLWPYEDKPADARRSLTRRFQVGNGSKGYIRQIDNRVMYPMNLVRDAVFIHLCNPRVFYTNYWIFGQSYNPYQALRYSKINGNLSCESQKTGGYFVYEYQGPDQPPCPTVSEDYMGKDALGVAAMVQAHELFAHYQHILDGAQMRESYGFEYQRMAQKTAKAVWQNDTGEFSRAFKHNQPWLQVWKNPKTGKRLLLFQDNFAEAFEPVTFTAIINGTKIQRKVEGNALYLEEL